MRSYLASAAAACLAVALSGVARADTLPVDGVTYSLTAVSLNSTTDQFTLDITGINGPSDTEGGRYGVQSFAFSEPTNFSSDVAPLNFTAGLGGLNSSGCNNSNASMVCFTNNTTPSAPALASDSSLSFVFDLTISSGDFLSYAPTFKINWDGTKNNYNLVSETLAPTFTGGGDQLTTPLPSTLPLFAAGIAMLAWFGWRRRQQALGASGLPI